jgi:hypothetical protein
VLVVWTGPVGAGWAGQTPPQAAAQKPAPAAVKKVPASAKGVVVPVKKATAPSKTSPRAQAGLRGAAKPAPGTKAAEAPKEEEKAPLIVGRRDPFKVPVEMSEMTGETMVGPLPPGNRGLIISQLQLEGIVRLDSTNAMIAVVTNVRKLAYFLKENDAVYNGVVSKITPDAVYFKENHLDQTGRVTTVDVVKRLSPAPGEGK